MLYTVCCKYDLLSKSPLHSPHQVAKKSLGLNFSLLTLKSYQPSANQAAGLFSIRSIFATYILIKFSFHYFGLVSKLPVNQDILSFAWRIHQLPGKSVFSAENLSQTCMRYMVYSLGPENKMEWGTWSNRYALAWTYVWQRRCCWLTFLDVLHLGVGYSNRVFTRFSKRPANFQQMYLKYTCNAGRLLDRVNILGPIYYA